MDRSTVEKLVKKAYAARDAGDVDGLMEAFHLDASFALAGDRNVLPAIGTTQGHTEIRQSLSGLMQTFQFVKRDIVNMLVEDHGAAVHCHATVRFVPTNTLATTEFVDLFKFDDDKIVKFVEFADTALIKHLVSG